MEVDHRIPVIGLTGGIASGKSTVVTILSELGAYIIDADRIVRDLQRKGQMVWRAIIESFGDGILTSQGELDRRALSAIIFNDPLARERLNRIVHPAVIEEISKQIVHVQSSNEVYAAIVVDVPLLYEIGMTGLFDQVWLVYVTESTQLARLTKRDGLDHDAALARIRAQMALDSKRDLADRIIDNEGGIDHTKAQVEALWWEIRR